MNYTTQGIVKIGECNRGEEEENEKKPIKQFRKRKKQQHKNSRHLKKVFYYTTLDIEVPQQQYQFHLFGDLLVDLEQLSNLDQIKFIQPIGRFKKSLKVTHNFQNESVEVLLEKTPSGMKEFRFVIEKLKQLDSSILSDFISKLSEYQELITKSRLLISADTNSHLNQKILTKPLLPKDVLDYSSINSYDTLSSAQFPEPSSLHDIQTIHTESWAFEMSLELARKSIDAFHLDCKKANKFIYYNIQRGYENEQITEIIGYPNVILSDFLCLNNAEIGYLLLRNPYLSPQIFHSRYLDIFLNRINYCHLQFSDDKSTAYPHQESPVLVNQHSLELGTVDNIQVLFDLKYYLQNLSKYAHRCSDQLLILEFTPVGNFKASDIINSQRFYKNQIMNTDSNHTIELLDKPKMEGNPQNLEGFSDLVYDAQSELFKEKYYTE